MIRARETVAIFVAGSSPQVITETLAVLLQRGQRVARVEVLTTAIGAGVVTEAFWGNAQRWRAFQREYPAARRARFTRRAITVLHDGHGTPLHDVRSAAESIAVCEQIVRFIAARTRDGSPPVHASLAGGRKTMGFALAIAMMLHARPEDTLSHVLVQPRELEGSDFYFPPRRPRAVEVAGPRSRRMTFAADAVRVELADLPFPRLRGIKEIRGRSSTGFTELVSRLQAELDGLAAPARIVVTAGRVLCGGQPVDLAPLERAIYAIVARRRRNGCGVSDCGGCERCFLDVAEIVRLGPTIPGQFGTWGGGARGWSVAAFRSVRSKINRALRATLGLASERYEVHAIGSRGARRYGLRVPAAAIAMEEG